MSITNGYTDLVTVKGRLGRTDTTDDTILESVVQMVSRWIDTWTNRFFYQQTATARYYSPKSATLCEVDDLVSVTEVAMDGNGTGNYTTIWASTDYWLGPYNAPNASPAQPYGWLEMTWWSHNAFIPLPRSMRITGTWGWPSVPDGIKEACALQSMRVYRRKDALFGVAGSADMGQMAILPKFDPDVALMLAPFRRIAVA